MRSRFVLFFLFVIILTLASVALVATYKRSNTATKLVQEGDVHIQNNNANLALERYGQAEKTMPLIKYTPSYKRRVAYAKSITELGSSPDVVVFLKDSTNQEDIDLFVKELEEMSGFKNLVFLTKEEAQEKYKKKITGENVDELFSTISSDDFLMSIEIYLENKDISDSIIKLTESKVFVQSAMQVD